MFVQVIQGKATDTEGLRKQWQKWDQELKPNSSGFLGSTAGVTSDGNFIAIARFEDEDSARSNSDKAEQSEWWEETSRYLENPTFEDYTNVDLMEEGGSDDAGFVQVIRGKVTDIEKAREINRSGQESMPNLRPDVIGGLVAWKEDGSFTNAIYFTSEAEARENEKKSETSPELQKFLNEWQSISAGEPSFTDLSDPWYSSK